MARMPTSRADVGAPFVITEVIGASRNIMFACSVGSAMRTRTVPVRANALPIVFVIATSRL